MAAWPRDLLAFASRLVNQAMAGMSRNEQVIGLERAGATGGGQLLLDGNVAIARGLGRRHGIFLRFGWRGAAPRDCGDEEKPGGHGRLPALEEEVVGIEAGDLVEDYLHVRNAVAVDIALDPDIVALDLVA